MAKDSISAGDRILAESYYQHAEHYIRIINEANGTFDLEKVTDRISGEVNNSDDFDGTAPIQEQKKSASSDDLSLPASILGDNIPVEEKEMESAD